ncbi:hypothetical protein [Hahella sp. CCB-MM4]|uniref:hypothetical protein n=1 Tax=Hahella sp. (strain CCB-MM4) TaxID=1926491 RepID=UPI001140048E|nr:hypothetical protein [Hahella sp. CCB-MM4]
MKWILKSLTPFILSILVFGTSQAAVSTSPPDPTIPNAVGFEGIIYDDSDVRALMKAYGVNFTMLRYQCELPVKRAISDASACRVRCSDQGVNILDVFAVDRLSVGQTKSGRQLLILSRTENHDGVKENGGVALLNATASCFFQGLKLQP